MKLMYNQISNSLHAIKTLTDVQKTFSANNIIKQYEVAKCTVRENAHCISACEEPNMHTNKVHTVTVTQGFLQKCERTTAFKCKELELQHLSRP